jgi:hypothetical protein
LTAPPSPLPTRRSRLGSLATEPHQFVSDGFGALPAGCHFHFDEVAQRDVLDQLRRAVPTDQRGLRALVREAAHAQLGLAQFLDETDVDLADVYAKDRSWTLLRRDAGLDTRPLHDDEAPTWVRRPPSCSRRLSATAHAIVGVDFGAPENRRSAAIATAAAVQLQPRVVAARSCNYVYFFRVLLNFIQFCLFF